MKKFLAGSAIATIFTTNDELIAVSTTQINDTINLSVESQEVRSGQGNALDYIYYHSSRMEGSLEDAQFNLDYIKHNIGAQESHEAQIYKSISHKLVTGTNTVNITGLIGENIWVYQDGRAYTFKATKQTGSVTFTNDTTLNDIDVCIKYLSDEVGGNIRNLTINANMIPNVVKVVLEAQLFASEAGVQDSSRIGTVQFVIPRAQLSGTQEISLTSSGVASTPLSYLALKADDAIASACSSATGVYGYITEVLETGNWYDGIKELVISEEDDASVVVGSSIETYAIANGDVAPFIVRPANRLMYGYSTDGINPVWPTDSGYSNTYITADGKITSLDGLKAIYVKIAETGVDTSISVIQEV